jgi:hypothetical protein
MEIACQAVFLGSCGLPDGPFLARQLGEFSDNTACSVFRGAQGPQSPHFLVLRAIWELRVLEPPETQSAERRKQPAFQWPCPRGDTGIAILGDDSPKKKKKDVFTPQPPQKVVVSAV